jgi:Rrf2 family protein
VGSNTNFSVAVHALTVLAYRGELTTSGLLAESINTNPVVVRRVLRGLVEAGLVDSSPGKNGGFALARRAKAIRLDDVRAAVGEGEVFRIHDNPENPACDISCHVRDVLDDVRDRVENAVERELHKTSLADVLKSTR